MHILDEDDTDGASVLCRQHLPNRLGRFCRHDAIENAGRVVDTGLSVEEQGDPSAHGVAIVVVLSFG